MIFKNIALELGWFVLESFAAGLSVPVIMSPVSSWKFYYKYSNLNWYLKISLWNRLICSRVFCCRVICSSYNVTKRQLNFIKKTTTVTYYHWQISVFFNLSLYLSLLTNVLKTSLLSILTLYFSIIRSL